MVKEITITVSEEQIKELGNAMSAYGDLLWSLELGLSVPDKYEDLRNSDLEPINRFNLLKQLYNDLNK